MKSVFSFWCVSLYVLTLCNAETVQDTAPPQAAVETVQDTTPPQAVETVQDTAPPQAVETVQDTAPPQNAKNCGNGEQQMRASVRYTTPRGVGYTNGYTTLEGFFVLTPCFQNSWIPFLDVRGHVFDTGKFAANTGLGVRYLSRSRLWGGNAYYDYRNNKHQHYNQLSAGFESLGSTWDFRINGYLPVGWKQSPLFDTRFYRFSGHSVLIKYKKEFAMKGANAEVGFHLDHFKKAPLYFAAGSYYLTGKGKTAWGGELRASAEFFDRYLRIEGNTSYDHFFKWIGQAQVSVNIPFGKSCKVTARDDQCCADAMTLSTRAMQRVERNEIIPVGRRRIITPAIDPATGQPWTFWFVNNTSHSAGTYESPFPTLLAAQNASSPNQGIYVFPGDGTTTGMNAGITLKDGQLFFGSGVSHLLSTTAGQITIPAMTSTSPSITNTGGNVVMLANNNVVSGFTITTALIDDSSGIFGDGISNFSAISNTFATSGMTTNGIFLNNPSGLIFVDNSTFSGFANINGGENGNGIYVNLDVGNTLGSLSVTGSSFNNILNPGFGDGGEGIFIKGSGTLAAFSASNNIFTNLIDSSSGIYNLGTITSFSASNNIFSNLNNAYSAITNGGMIDSFISSDNTFTNIMNLVSSSVIGNFGTIDNFRSSGDNFSTITNCDCIGLSNITNFICSNDTFTDLRVNNSRGISYSTGSGTVSANITGNTFSASDIPPTNGFGVSITVNGGSLCLDFTGNQATPSSGYNAYVFSQTGGTFNTTVGSDNTTNTGTFQTTGTIGTCTLP